MKRRYRLTDRGWAVVTAFCCTVVVILTWTVVPIVAPWAHVRL